MEKLRSLQFKTQAVTFEIDQKWELSALRSIKFRKQVNEMILHRIEQIL